MTERWLPIPGFELSYEVSDQGRVRSLMMATGAGLRRRSLPFVVTPRKTRTGHCRVTMGRGVDALVHRLVLLAFVGPAPEGTEGSHLNGDPSDNRLANLVWETRRENFARKIEHGTAARGEASPVAVLTGAQVREIRALVASGASQDSLAERFGVNQSTISRIVTGRRWAALVG